MIQTGEQTPRAPLLKPPPHRLVDLPRLERGMMALIPPPRREEIRGLMDRIGQAVGGFFRGQLLVGASIAGLFGMLVIVPLVAVAKIVFLFIWSKYVDYGEELTQGDPN